MEDQSIRNIALLEDHALLRLAWPLGDQIRL